MSATSNLQVEHTGTGEQNTGLRLINARVEHARKLTGQTNGAHKSDIDNVLMTETCCSEVNLVLPGNSYDVPQGGRREE